MPCHPPITTRKHSSCCFLAFEACASAFSSPQIPVLLSKYARLAMQSAWRVGRLAAERIAKRATLQYKPTSEAEDLISQALAKASCVLSAAATSKGLGQQRHPPNFHLDSPVFATGSPPGLAYSSAGCSLSRLVNHISSQDSKAPIPADKD
jgi:hypothetical protein